MPSPALAFGAALAIVQALAGPNDRPDVQIRVVDATRAVVVGAELTIVATKRGLAKPADYITDARGEVNVSLDAGEYEIRVSASGFNRATRRFHVQPRKNVVVVELALAAVEERVEVKRDTDWMENAFVTVLTPEMIMHLPDDPEEFERMLYKLGGPGTRLRVNGFDAVRLPPKNQIQFIRFRRDEFSAENHDPGATYVDITTKPGLAHWAGGAGGTLRPTLLSARDPLARGDTPETRIRNRLSFSGPLVVKRTSVAGDLDIARARDWATVHAKIPGLVMNESVPRSLLDYGSSLRIDHALSQTHVIRGEAHVQYRTHENLGIGGFNLRERAFRQQSVDVTTRVAHAGPLSAKVFSEFRAQSEWRRVENTPVTDVPAILVMGAFSSGGAGNAGRSRHSGIDLRHDVDVLLGRHALRSGALLNVSRRTSDVVENRAGTFVFPSLEAFTSRAPELFTRRIAVYTPRSTQAQFAAYIHDHIRLSRVLALSVGARYERQNIVPDGGGIAPRAAMLWAPRAGTAARLGVGAFYSWLPHEAYDRTVRVNGLNQYEEIVFSPAFDEVAEPPLRLVPPGRFQLGSGLQMPIGWRMTASVQQQLRSRGQISISLAEATGRHLYSGALLNRPDTSGHRPDITIGNVVEVRSDGRSRYRSVSIGFSQTLPWLRTYVITRYSWTRSLNNTDGPFALAPGGDRTDEWSVASGSVAHSFVCLSGLRWRQLNVSGSLTAQSGSPYTITTGSDDNDDGIVNDRPAGYGRNSAVVQNQWETTARISWSFGFGARGSDVGSRVRSTAGDGGVMTTEVLPPEEVKRFQFELYVSARNILNRSTVTAYGSQLTSPFFNEPISTLPGRRVDMGIQLGF